MLRDVSEHKFWFSDSSPGLARKLTKSMELAAVVIVLCFCGSCDANYLCHFLSSTAIRDRKEIHLTSQEYRRAMFNELLLLGKIRIWQKEWMKVVIAMWWSWHACAFLLVSVIYISLGSNNQHSDEGPVLKSQALGGSFIKSLMTWNCDQKRRKLQSFRRAFLLNFKALIFTQQLSIDNNHCDKQIIENSFLIIRNVNKHR